MVIDIDGSTVIVAQTYRDFDPRPSAGRMRKIVRARAIPCTPRRVPHYLRDFQSGTCRYGSKDWSPPGCVCKQTIVFRYPCRAGGTPALPANDNVTLGYVVL